MKSDAVKVGIERAPHRSLLWATGQIKSHVDFKKPFIGVCNSFIEIIPGHVHLNELGRLAKDAVREAGGIVTTLEGAGCPVAPTSVVRGVLIRVASHDATLTATSSAARTMHTGMRANCQAEGAKSLRGATVVTYWIGPASSARGLMQAI